MADSKNPAVPGPGQTAPVAAQSGAPPEELAQRGAGVPGHVAAKAEVGKTGGGQSTPPGDLAAAGETSNADVQQLLAERVIHEQNRDEEQLAKVDAALAELGYRV